MKLYSIDTELFKLDGGAMFGVVPKVLWSKTNPADENNLCTWAMRLLLIEDGDQLILIDTGLGDKQSEKFFGHYYLDHTNTLDKSLAKHGFHRDDITDVFLTHLHFDHVGGAIKREGDRLVPAFKNAYFWSNKKHWEWATNPNPREKASFLTENIIPIEESGRLKFVEDHNSGILNPNISIRFAFGHTDAMMLPQIKYKDKIILYMADLLPSIGHIPLPYVMAYDMFPLKTLEERAKYWKEIADHEYILFLEHDPVHECCTLQHTEKGVRLKETFSLATILAF